MSWVVVSVTGGGMVSGLGPGHSGAGHTGTLAPIYSLQWVVSEWCWHQCSAALCWTLHHWLLS